MAQDISNMDVEFYFQAYQNLISLAPKRLNDHTAYKLGGAADTQLRQAAATCVVPGALRRVTWQEVIRACSDTADLTWLPKAMKEKHGIYPQT